MALFGYAVRWLYRTYGEHATLDPMRAAVHILILVQLAHFHGSVAFDVIYLLRLLILLGALRWLGRRMELVELRDDQGELVKA